MTHRVDRTTQSRRWLQAGALAAGVGAAYVTVSVTPDGKTVSVKSRLGTLQTFNIPAGQTVAVKPDSSRGYGLFAGSSLITFFNLS